MPRKTDTRSRILDVAQPLLQARGFNGFSYRHLADTLGVKTAAIHYHFPSKADLGVELIERLTRRLRRWAAATDARTQNFWERLDGYFALHAEYMEDKVACPAGITQAEFDAIPESMRAAVRALATEAHGWLTRTLQHGLDSGSCEFRGNASDQATLIAAAVQGALLIARACGSDRYHATVAQLKQQMARLA